MNPQTPISCFVDRMCVIGYTVSYRAGVLLMGGLHSSCVSCKKKPAAQTAHLVFAETKANAEEPKELFFANARTD